MKYMKSVLASAVVGVALIVSSGCEWSSGNEVESFNSRYNFLNFSGLYRGLEAGLLITDYSSEVDPVGTNGASVVTNLIARTELLHTYSGSGPIVAQTDFRPVARGSVTVSGGGFTATDTDGDGNMTAQNSYSSAVASFDYANGVFKLTSWGVATPVDANTQFYITYQYEKVGEFAAGGGTGSGPRGNATSGTSKKPIYSFAIEQTGNRLRITDNNGAIYDGSLGDIRSAGGVDQNNNQQNGGGYVPSAGDEFIAQFSATGTSAAGYRVRIVGTLQAVVASAPTSSGGTDGESTGVSTVSSVQLGQRQLLGTWIEEGGRQGNVRGQSSPIAVTVTR